MKIITIVAVIVVIVVDNILLPIHFSGNLRITFLLLLCPVDPPTPEARNAVEDAAKIPREVYREQDIVHNNDENDGDDGNNLQRHWR